MTIETILPISASVQVTAQCNLRCTHCAVDSSSAVRDCWSEGMVDHFFQSLDTRTPILDLTGGEPLMAWKIVKRFGKEAAERDMLWGLTTNGLLLTKKRINELSDMRVYGVKVSLEGTRRYHENVRGDKTFDKAIAAIGNLVDRGLRVGVQTAVSRLNEASIPELINILDGIGVSTHILFPLLPLGRQAGCPDHVLKAQELKRFILRLRSITTRRMKIYCELPQCASLLNDHPVNEEARCGVGYMIHFTALGDAWPCPAFPLVLGNIRDKSLNDLMQHPVQVVLRSRSGICQPCGDCQSFAQCGGGCRAMAYVMENNLLAADPFCWHAEQTYASQ